MLVFTQIFSSSRINHATILLMEFWTMCLVFHAALNQSGVCMADCLSNSWMRNGPFVLYLMEGTTWVFLDNASVYSTDEKVEEVLKRRNIELGSLPKCDSDLCQRADYLILKKGKILARYVG